MSSLPLTSILRRAASLHGRACALQCGTTSWTYADLSHRAEQWAAALRGLGMAPGDRVAILHENCHRFLQAALGAVAGRFVLVPLNVRLDAATLGEMLSDCGARAIVASSSFRRLGEGAVGSSGKAIALVDPENLPEGIGGSEAPGRCDDVAQLYYTSGTTGRPRGVMLTQENISSHALMTIAELHLSDADVWAHVAPMFHLADAWAVFAMTWVGARHVMFPTFDPEAVLDGFVTHRVTITNLVPTMLNRLVEGAAERRFPALRAILSGGAPIAPALVARVAAAFGTRYIQTYGLTETSPYLTFSILPDALACASEEERLRMAARTGRAALGVELVVAGSDGSPVPRDDRSVGEIRVRAPWVTPGYWNRPDDTSAAFQDGWFLTGDLATWDATGSVNIVDRKKDMIITGGEKVFSVEVERALAAHPAVFECAVVGLPDPDWGEAVCAAVVLRAGARCAGDELESFLRDRLAAFKVPKRFVFCEELPKTGSGKIRKAEIRHRILQTGTRGSRWAAR